MAVICTPAYWSRHGWPAFWVKIQFMPGSLSCPLYHFCSSRIIEYALLVPLNVTQKILIMNHPTMIPSTALRPTNPHSTNNSCLYVRSDQCLLLYLPPSARGCHWWRKHAPPPRTAHYWLLVVQLKGPRNGWRVLVKAPQPDTRGGDSPSGAVQSECHDEELLSGSVGNHKWNWRIIRRVWEAQRGVACSPPSRGPCWLGTHGAPRSCRLLGVAQLLSGRLYQGQ